MIKQKITGFQHVVFPFLVEAFLFLLLLSIAETIYKTPYGNWGVYCAVLLCFFSVTAVIVQGMTCSYEYRLMQDTLVLCYYVRGVEKRRHTVHLRASNINLRRSSHSVWSFRTLGKTYRYCLPFFSRLRPASIVYQASNGLLCRLVFKPSDEMCAALAQVLKQNNKN